MVTGIEDVFMTILTCPLQELDPYFTFLVVLNMNHNSMLARRVTALPYVTKVTISSPAV